MSIKEYDCLLIGAGFGSICLLSRLQKQNLSVRIFEKGANSGGVWYWNCYPGARVDSDAPIYQLFDKEVYEEFSFTERYPGWRELRRYFKYLDDKLQFSKHVDYNCTVESARFDENRRQWLVKCSNGTQAYCRFLVPAIGFAAKSYTPALKNIDKFKGIMHHTAEWPQEDVDLVGKRIAVIGTGSSGVQAIQECGRDAKHLTVFQRTPNYAVPMKQRKLTPEEVRKMKDDGGFEKAFKSCYETFAGFQYDFSDKNTFDDSPEEREKFYNDKLNVTGGFAFWLATYGDMLKDSKANMEAYKYWRNSVVKRIKDPAKAEILAPENPPHPWGTKRPSLEQYYYEIYNFDHVDLVDLQQNPITELDETGIKTSDGKHIEVDVIILATGFDAVTGSLAQLDIRGVNGETISDHWSNGLKTSIGIALHNFPNLFFLYGPQAPTAFSNGPSCVQVQARWLEAMFKVLGEKHISRVEATEKSETDWTERTHKEWNSGLFPQAKSWYSGANIPGKKVEPLNWSGGIPAYVEALNSSLENNLQGWIISAGAN